ncbi:uncharacterized protein PGTG_08689 [Puccinia graminis f. sp. tritici CRL 75-36-700-3]|uniref:Uncharacterized protein n=1 Tax=Puccinia graminis f. sp. tritici (strain CRL 75-36-700-3 / race SCCL) TaxID=418459 RepID=E3KGS8_PUCGT|nr:uncharacterized protein PGTG_08689 [Puccinia graminis f. sp. tritici CRL 75-36-700-3]EFP83503.2 hypothetical protein PGTG_08689 [Puccinia graminis f. sp. tritici CRL 75-36-700-3]
MYPLPRLIARTGRSDESSVRPVRSSGLSGNRSDSSVRADGPSYHLPTARIGLSDLSSDGHVRELLGQAGPRPCRTGRCDKLILAVCVSHVRKPELGALSHTFRGRPV